MGRFLALAILTLAVPAQLWAGTRVWYDEAARLRAEDPREAREAKGRLRADPALEAELREALRSPERRSRALEVIADLRIVAFLPDVLSLLKDEASWPPLRTALALRGSDRGNELGSLVRGWIENRWASVDPSLRPSLLRAAGELSLRISPARLGDILSDGSYEARIESAHLAGELLLRTGDTAYSAVLAKAVRGSPYQLRQEALYRIRSLKPSARERFASELRGCSADPNGAVRGLCGQGSQSGQSSQSSKDGLGK